MVNGGSESVSLLPNHDRSRRPGQTRHRAVLVLAACCVLVLCGLVAVARVRHTVLVESLQKERADAARIERENRKLEAEEAQLISAIRQRKAQPVRTPARPLPKVRFQPSQTTKLERQNAKLSLQNAALKHQLLMQRVSERWMRFHLLRIF